MNTFDRILKEQQEKRIAQSEKDKKVVEAMFSNNSRILNNNYLLNQINK
jgi:hypothetical protein